MLSGANRNIQRKPVTNRCGGRRRCIAILAFQMGRMPIVAGNLSLTGRHLFMHTAQTLAESQILHALKHRVFWLVWRYQVSPLPRAVPLPSLCETGFPPSERLASSRELRVRLCAFKREHLAKMSLSIKTPHRDIPRTRNNYSDSAPHNPPSKSVFHDPPSSSVTICSTGTEPSKRHIPRHCGGSTTRLLGGSSNKMIKINATLTYRTKPPTGLAPRRTRNCGKYSRMIS